MSRTSVVFHEAMAGHYKPEFMKVTFQEAEGQTENEKWIIAKRTDLSLPTRILSR